MIGRQVEEVGFWRSHGSIFVAPSDAILEETLGIVDLGGGGEGGGRKEEKKRKWKEREEEFPRREV